MDQCSNQAAVYSNMATTYNQQQPFAATDSTANYRKMNNTYQPDTGSSSYQTQDHPTSNYNTDCHANHTEAYKFYYETNFAAANFNGYQDNSAETYPHINNPHQPNTTQTNSGVNNSYNMHNIQAYSNMNCNNRPSTTNYNLSSCYQQNTMATFPDLPNGYYQSQGVSAPNNCIPNSTTTYQDVNNSYQPEYAAYLNMINGYQPQSSNSIINNSYQPGNTAPPSKMSDRYQSNSAETRPDTSHELSNNQYKSQVTHAALALNNLSEQPKQTTTTKFLSAQIDYGTPTRKPACSYITMIAMALENAPQKKCTLREIITFITETFPFYRQNQKWHQTIKHNLTLNDCFVKAGRRLGDRGCLWMLDAAYEDMYKHGSAQRRKSRVLEGRENKYRQNRKSKKLKQVNGKSKSSTKDNQLKEPERLQPTIDLQINVSTFSQQTNSNTSSSDGCRLASQANQTSLPDAVHQCQNNDTLSQLNCSNIDWKALIEELQWASHDINPSSVVEDLHLNHFTSVEQSVNHKVLSTAKPEHSEHQITTETPSVSTCDVNLMLGPATSTSKNPEKDVNSQVSTQENTSEKSMITTVPDLDLPNISEPTTEPMSCLESSAFPEQSIDTSPHQQQLLANNFTELRFGSGFELESFSPDPYIEFGDEFL